MLNIVHSHNLCPLCLTPRTGPGPGSPPYPPTPPPPPHTHLVLHTLNVPGGDRVCVRLNGCPRNSLQAPADHPPPHPNPQPHTPPQVDRCLLTKTSSPETKWISHWPLKKKGASEILILHHWSLKSRNIWKGYTSKRGRTEAMRGQKQITFSSDWTTPQGQSLSSLAPVFSLQKRPILRLQKVCYL